MQRGERDAPFEPGQRRAEAVVDAVPEGEVGAVGAVDVERLGVAVAGRSRLAAASDTITWAPAGITTSPIGTSSVA